MAGLGAESELDKVFTCYICSFTIPYSTECAILGCRRLMVKDCGLGVEFITIFIFEHSVCTRARIYEVR